MAAWVNESRRTPRESRTQICHAIDSLDVSLMIFMHRGVAVSIRLSDYQTISVRVRVHRLVVSRMNRNCY
jgi:hypothetical protein